MESHKLLKTIILFISCIIRKTCNYNKNKANNHNHINLCKHSYHSLKTSCLCIKLSLSTCGLTVYKSGAVPSRPKRKSYKEYNQKYYEGRLISNRHIAIFCRQSKVAMRAQCVLVATTLLHKGAKFHSFIYAGSETVRVDMESCYGGYVNEIEPTCGY